MLLVIAQRAKNTNAPNPRNHCFSTSSRHAHGSFSGLICSTSMDRTISSLLTIIRNSLMFARCPHAATVAQLLMLHNKCFPSKAFPRKSLVTRANISVRRHTNHSLPMCFTHVTSSPHFPQSKGFVERAIQTIKRTMTQAKSSGQNINMALLCLRTTPIDSKLPSPSEILCNRKVKSNLPIIIKNTLPHNDQIYNRHTERQDNGKLITIGLHMTYSNSNQANLSVYRILVPVCGHQRKSNNAVRNRVLIWSSHQTVASYVVTAITYAILNQ